MSTIEVLYQTYSIWLSFFSYTITTAISPGPNNILALSATSNYGIKKSRNLLWGIYLGFFTIQLFCGIFSSFIITLIPNILPYIKYIGAAYILWMAYHVAVSTPVDKDRNTNEISFWRGYILQFANIKIILWGITAFTSYILPYNPSPTEIISFTLLLTAIGSGATFIWSIAGSLFNPILKKYFRITNIIMALMLVYSSVHLII